MAGAADDLRRQAISLYTPHEHEAPPWHGLRRVQQQLLTRLLMRGLESGPETLAFTPSDMVEWYGISANTAREWLDAWRKEGFVQPARAGVQRVRSYVLTPNWADLLKGALFGTSGSTS